MVSTTKYKSNNKKYSTYERNKNDWACRGTSLTTKTNKQKTVKNTKEENWKLVQKVRASLVAQIVKNLQCGRPGFDPWVRKIP